MFHTPPRKGFRPVANQQRKALRFIKRELKAQEYRATALAGGGKREVARRSGELARQRALSEAA